MKQKWEAVDLDRDGPSIAMVARSAFLIGHILLARSHPFGPEDERCSPTPKFPLLHYSERIRRPVHLQLARAARTRQYVSMKVRRLFERGLDGQRLHDKLDIRAIASRMKKAFSKTAATTAEGRRSAVAPRPQGVRT